MMKFKWFGHVLSVCVLSGGDGAVYIASELRLIIPQNGEHGSSSVPVKENLNAKYSALYFMESLFFVSQKGLCLLRPMYQ